MPVPLEFCWNQVSLDPSGSIEIRWSERRRGTYAAHEYAAAVTGKTSSSTPLGRDSWKFGAAAGDTDGGQPPPSFAAHFGRSPADGSLLAMAAAWPSLPAAPAQATRSTALSGRSSTRSLPTISKPCAVVVRPTNRWFGSLPRARPCFCLLRQFGGLSSHSSVRKEVVPTPLDELTGAHAAPCCRRAARTRARRRPG
jgi:hypothetical protein